MKKSERKKVKFNAILMEKSHIEVCGGELIERFLERNDGVLERYAVKRTIYKLHGLLFSLRAIEKQVELPVQVVVRSTIYKPTKYVEVDDVCECIILKKYYCPRCRHKLDILFDYTSDDEEFLFKHMQPKYCPYCGQKLWWRNKND